MSLGRMIKLNNGVRMPQIGLGTWQSPPGQVAKAVEHALKTGYRHIDAALIYQNQDEVGDGIKNSGVDRKDIFITSKLWNNSHRPERVEADLNLTLKQLKTDYLDLWLIHWPVAFKPVDQLITKSEDGSEVVIDDDAPSIVETWKKVVEVYGKGDGKVRAVGVSNFTVDHLNKIINATGFVPAVNQIEAHPGLQQPELEAFCKEKGIHLTAYSPLGNNVTGRPAIKDDPKIAEIAKKLNKDPAQVLIAWCAHKGYSVIPKSVTPSRIESNFQDFELDQADFDAISELGKQNPVRYNNPILYKPKWDINIFNSSEEQRANRKVW